MENYTHNEVEKWWTPIVSAYSHEWTPKPKNMRNLKRYLLLSIGIFLMLPIPNYFSIELGSFPVTEAEVTKAVPELKPAPTPFSKYTPVTEKDKRVVAYVKRFKTTALAEQEKFNIPASIKLAQGIVESKYGTSRLATQNNNHFGIKCFSRKCKKGHCSNYTDDSHKDFFRIYGSAWESYRAHSKFLSGKDRYKGCFDCKTYGEWAKCLKKSGYATAKHYAETLTGIIERYGLWEFDNIN